jgi:hypothetical protein
VGGAVATEHASPSAVHIVLVATSDTAAEKEDRGEEQGDEGAPREAECVVADLSGHAVAVEDVAGLDEFDAVEVSM